MSRPGVSVLFGVVLAAIPTAARDATEWGQITAADRALREVSFAPNAPAVILEEDIRYTVALGNEPSSTEVYRRIKILNQEGMRAGTVKLQVNDYNRVRDLQARTMLPDGRELALPADAVFRTEESSSDGEERLAFALPGVIPGAIIEFRYRTFSDSSAVARHWIQGPFPMLRSRVSYELPRTWPVKCRYLGPPEMVADRESLSGARSNTLVHHFQSVPAVPDEPYGPPFRDRSASLIFDLFGPQDPAPTTEGWEEIVRRAQTGGYKNYADARRRDGDARRLAVELASGAPGATDKARIIYQYVRDHIAAPTTTGIWAGLRTVDAILKAGEGTLIEQALLLQAMLRGVGIDAGLGWSRLKTHGEIHRKLVYPGAFNMFLVAAPLDGRVVYLLPFGTNLPFGMLPTTLEGAACLLVDQEPLAWVNLPESPASFSTRSAELEYVLGADGGLTGTGSLELTGHPARDWFVREVAEEKARGDWEEWLAPWFPGLRVVVDTVRGDAEAPRVRIDWHVEAAPSDDPGVDVVLPVAAPLARRENPFTLPAAARLTPVVLPFRESSQVTLRVTWPAGWSLRPLQGRTLRNRAGAVSAEFQVNDSERRLTGSRKLEIERTGFAVRDYNQVRALYEAAATTDAELLVLMRD